MTLTAPVPTFDLAALVRAGRPMVAAARLQPSEHRGASLHAARGAVRQAIERNLEGLRIDPDDGVLDYELHLDAHGWLVTGVWRAF